MFKFKNVTKEEKIEQIIVVVIFLLSIGTGVFVGGNEEWFRNAHFSAGYMAGSLVTCVVLFSIYQLVNVVMGFSKKNAQTH
ncbi:hypothetical protein JSY36_17425 [Bacillus sp. H-16]|uniref:hypothetical protein n=1 Tax=Alteribacter salitolerans TaxID=2912333 RepID=UPI00196319CA|nr:hypothetical protein [Alteribacter salitolerans]MBM7097517.1 hypothetical protein [Alteribacter salitolerans]